MSKIVVYCTKGNVIFNKDGEIQKVSKPKNSKLRKNIVHDIFLDMENFNDDEFWNTFLLRASRDLFPSGFGFRDNTLYYTVKTKYNFELKLNPNEPEESLSKLKEFMNNKGVMSITDKNNINTNVQGYNKESEKINDWKKLGKKQNIAIRDYLEVLKIRYKLNKNEFRWLDMIVSIGVSSNILNNKNIIIENGVIINIDILEWNETERIFDINTNGIKISKNTNKVNKRDRCNTVDTSSNIDVHNKKVLTKNIREKWFSFLDTVFKEN